MGRMGDVRWAAPEMLANKPYDEKVDVYSFGVLLWQLITRKVPLGNIELIFNVPKKVIQGERPAVDDSVRQHILFQVIQQCWENDPTKRPSFAQIIDILTVLEHQVAKEPPIPPTRRPSSLKNELCRSLEMHSQWSSVRSQNSQFR
jgi:sterile alpha motif and leucine zipper-containing kinase AZK